MRFIMIDRITQLESGTRAHAIKAVTTTEDFFTDHFPGNPVMPSALVVEAMAQTAEALLAASSDFSKCALLSAVDTARFRALVRPGDLLEISVDIASQDPHNAEVRARARVAGTVVAIAILHFALVPADCVINPDHLESWRRQLTAHVQGSEALLAVH